MQNSLSIAEIDNTHFEPAHGNEIELLSFSEKCFQKNDLGKTLYERYFVHARWTQSQSGDITIFAPTSFHAKGIQRNLGDIKDLLPGPVNEVTLYKKPKPSPSIGKQLEKPQMQGPRQPSLPLPPRRPRQSSGVDQRSPTPPLVSSPALSPCQRLVQRWSEQCFTRPGFTQVLWLHGEPGCGKTHLIRQLNKWVNPHKRLVFCDVIGFLHDWRQSMENKTQLQFAQKYRQNTDLLVIEGIENLRNKKGTQEELLYTISCLLDRGAALAVSSSVHPLVLQEHIHPSLYSRLMGGLSVEIPHLDRAFKESLWRHMLETNFLENQSLDVRCYERLMNLATKTVRQSKSAFIKALGYLSLRGKLELEDLSKLERMYLPAQSLQTRSCHPQILIEELSQLCGLSMAAIKGTSRRSDISLARRFIFLALSKYFGLTNSVIACYTEKDPSSVCHGIRIIEKDIATKRHIGEQWNWICQQLGLLNEHTSTHSAVHN